MSEPTEQEKEATKQRMRDALDVLGEFTTDEGKLDATKMTRTIKELRNQLKNCKIERDEAEEHEESMIDLVRKQKDYLVEQAEENIRLRGIIKLTGWVPVSNPPVLKQTASGMVISDVVNVIVQLPHGIRSVNAGYLDDNGKWRGMNDREFIKVTHWANMQDLPEVSDE